MSIKISIYEDNQTLCEALSLFAETTANFELVGAHGHFQCLEKQMTFQ